MSILLLSRRAVKFLHRAICKLFVTVEGRLEQINVVQLSFAERAEYKLLMGVALFETATICEAINRFEKCIRIAKEI